jgi:hypothetical protein
MQHTMPSYQAGSGGPTGALGGNKSGTAGVGVGSASAAQYTALTHALEKNTQLTHNNTIAMQHSQEMQLGGIASGLLGLGLTALQGGGAIDTAGAYYLHAGEHVLNPLETEELHRTGAVTGYGRGESAGSIQFGGSTTTEGDTAFNFHYHAGAVSALDSTGVADILKQHPATLTKIIKDAVIRGAISKRSFR